MRRGMAALAVALAAIVGGLAVNAAGAPSADRPNPNRPDPNHPGRTIYVARCASCHDAPAAGSRAATFAQITGRSADELHDVLSEGGVMAPMAAGLSAAEVDKLIDYLTSGQPQANGSWAEAMMCPPGDRLVRTDGRVAFGGFGADPRSTRRLTALQAGLTKRDLARLEVAWAVGFPQTQSLGTGVAVLGDTAYVTAAGRLLAIDAVKGCARWSKPYGSYNTPQIGDVDGRRVLLLSVRGEVIMIDAATGAEIWRADGRPANGMGAIRGGVVLYRDKVIVPISASGVGAGGNPNFECCIGHGAVVALAAKDGRRLWAYDTMPEAGYTGRVSRTGVKQRGPSGAPIWAMPTIDAKRNRVIVATGENTSHPGTETSDALIALDLDTGKPAWVFQAMKADVWNMACNDREPQKSGPNCPNLYDSDKGRDFDFGATPVLVTVAGRDVVLDGQKSGHVWALDAATGKVLWQDGIGEGSDLGGVHWGLTTDGDRVFVPIADSEFTEAEQARNMAGVYAYRITDGRRVWSHKARADCGPDRAARIVNCRTKFGYSAAPLTVDGAVVAATLDGKVTVLDGRTGKVLRSIDTAKPMRTANGVAGKGGSVDAHALSAGAGAVFVTSGYGAFDQTPGNVLIALRPRR